MGSLNFVFLLRSWIYGFTSITAEAKHMCICLRIVVQRGCFLKLVFSRSDLRVQDPDHVSQSCPQDPPHPPLDNIWSSISYVCVPFRDLFTVQVMERLKKGGFVNNLDLPFFMTLIPLCCLTLIFNLCLSSIKDKV